MARDLTPGLVLGVRWGDAVWVEAYGVTDAAQPEPMRPSTQLYIGSISKQFTAACILRLVERDLLGLDWPVSRVLRDAPERWSDVTIHHLLTHTSGINSYGSLPYELGEGVLPSKTLLAFITSAGTFFEPGTDYVYSSADYAVLACVVEEVSGTSYGDFLERTFLAPLGLRDTGYWVDRRPPNLAMNHKVYIEGAATFTPYINVSLGLGASSIHSTVADLLRWQKALVDGRVVSPASYALMVTPASYLASNGTRESVDYGYGLQLEFDEGGALFGVGHGGINAGHIGWLWGYPTKDIAFVALQNSDGMLPPLLDRIEEVLLQEAE